TDEVVVALFKAMLVVPPQPELVAVGVFVGRGVFVTVGVLLGVGLGPGVGVLVGGAGVFVRVGVAVGAGAPPLSCAPMSYAPPCGIGLPKKSREPILLTLPNATRSAPALIACEP